jgi:endo-1,4-beta-xylanase
MKTFFILLISLVPVTCIQSYAQLAQDKCKFLGNVIASAIPDDFDTYWNQVTPENAGKWGSVENSRDVMNWTGLDLAYNYAKSKGFPFKQHTFIWGNQQPSWIEPLEPEEQLEEIEEWIKAYCERYPDTDYIDVVNEPIHDAPSGSGNGNYISALGGTGETGYDWVIKSFELARQHCPDAKLLINEYNIIHDFNKTNQYLAIINLLKARGLLDGIGVQGHRFELENATNAVLKSNLDKLGATGFPIYISEFDLGNLGNTGTPNDTQQSDLYKRIFPLLWNHPSVEGITLWGYREGEIWQSTAFLKRSNGTERPAFTWLKSYVPSAPGSTYCVPVSVPGEEGLDMSIFPNPATGGTFTFTVPEGKTLVTLKNAQGSVVMSTEVTGSTHRIGGLTSGVYFLIAQGTTGTTVQKVIVH